MANNDIHKPGELVVSNVWGKSPIQSINGEEYYISFIDVATRFTTITFLKKKLDVLNTFREYKAFLETQTGHKLKRLWTDNGGKYMGDKFWNMCKQNGIYIKYTAPHSPHQNRITEQFNQTVAEGAQTMLIEKNLPKFLWSEAMWHVTYLKNRTPHWALKHVTPHQAFWKWKPDFMGIQEFRSCAGSLIEVKTQNWTWKARKWCSLDMQRTDKSSVTGIKCHTAYRQCMTWYLNRILHIQVSHQCHSLRGREWLHNNSNNKPTTLH